MYITPRTLLGIIRLAQAHAKLHFRNVVTIEDVNEGIKLMDYSMTTLNERTKSSKKISKPSFFKSCHREKLGRL